MFWHSSAHILGEAMERHYGGCLCYGPPVDDGFYYDMFIEDRCAAQFVCCVDLLCAFSSCLEAVFCRNVSQAEFKQLDTIVKKVVKEKQPFERLEVKKEDLLKMFEV